MRREFPYFCLDCERIVYLERYDIGKTKCSVCCGRLVPLSAVFPLRPSPYPFQREGRGAGGSLKEGRRKFS